MSFHKISDAELRTSCKEAIETLEFWLRRVIDMVLRPVFGDGYINACDQKSGEYVFKKELRDRINKRITRHPKRYPRNVDAALLEDEIYIVCRGDLYKKFFQPFFKFSYPGGSEELRFFLEKIITPRNHLAHSNPIRIRQAEQVICCSHDVIDAMKMEMEERNMGKEYNAPTIIKISDLTNGLAFHDAQISRHSTGRGHVHVSGRSSVRLRAGDKLSIEVDIDQSFSPKDYHVEWVYANQAPEHIGPLENRITIDILECHVREDFTVYCMVISNQPWHRCGDVDDAVGLTYKVLPPL